MTRPETHRTIGKSIADQNFGENLPGLGSDTTVRASNVQSGNSFFDIKSHGSNSTNNAGDILFLKRLLFLKASLDNETALTASQAKLPDEDKAFYPQASDMSTNRMLSAP